MKDITIEGSTFSIPDDATVQHYPGTPPQYVLRDTKGDIAYINFLNGAMNLYTAERPGIGIRNEFRKGKRKTSITVPLL